MKKQIPYGVASYEKLVEGNYYYVDKTAYIRELERFETPVFLRPRRFGKSLWCSTLACYYDINRKDRFRELFENTDIGRAPTPSHSSMLTLEFDFSPITVKGSVDDIADSFRTSAFASMDEFAAAYEDYADFKPALEKKNASDALVVILSTVRKKRLPKLCVIIDEYDNFTNQLVTARRDDDYQDITTSDSFLKTFYKTLKAGVGKNTVGRVFITGVLPITLDDLTSGFNIGKVVGDRPRLVSMMGFTQTELEKYVGEIFADYGWGAELRGRVLNDMKNLYDGHRFIPDAEESLYNSTACNFYLDWLVDTGGKIPNETVDDNLRTDIGWFRRLAGTDAEAKKKMEGLMAGGSASYVPSMLAGRFNASKFLDPDFLTASLFHLGVLTVRDDFDLCFPNTVMKRIFSEYFNEMEDIDLTEGLMKVSRALSRVFASGGGWDAVFSAYWKNYIEQIPAQVYDNMDENFFRTTFYMMCVQPLSKRYMLTIEANLHSGRCDFLALPRPDRGRTEGAVLEFKYYKAADARRLGVMDWKEPPAEALAQAQGYAADVRAMFPQYAVAAHVVCIAGTAGYRFFPGEAVR